MQNISCHTDSEAPTAEHKFLFRVLAHLRLARWFVGGKFEGELGGARAGVGAKRGTIVDDPVGAGGEEGLVVCGGANRENAGAGSFAGTRAGRCVFDNDTELRVEMDGCSAFLVGLGIGLAALNVTGGDEMVDELPEASGAEAHFGEGTRGGSDHGELTRGQRGEQFPRAGEADDAGEIFDFRALHPGIISEMNGRVGVREKSLDGDETGAAVSELDDVIGIHIVFLSPARPDPGDGGSRVDKHAVHINEQALADNLRHRSGRSNLIKRSWRYWAGVRR